MRLIRPKYISQIMSKPKSKALKISIDGNISSGKSTVVNNLATFFSNKCPTSPTRSSPSGGGSHLKQPKVSVEIVPEPLEKWTNLDGHNLLDMFYKDPTRNNFIFQHFVQLTRLVDIVGGGGGGSDKENKSIPNGQGQDGQIIKLFERSLQNNRYCFIELAKRQGTLEEVEYHVLCEWYKWLDENLDLGLDLIIYLRTSPEVVYERMQRRGRVEESSVPIQYLEALHQTYENWLGSPQDEVDSKSMDGEDKKYRQNQNVIIVDANKSQEEVAEECSRLVREFFDRRSAPIELENGHSTSIELLKNI